MQTKKTKETGVKMNVMMNMDTIIILQLFKYTIMLNVMANNIDNNMNYVNCILSY